MKKYKDVIAFTRELIALNTVNPPGNEAAAAELAGDMLSKNGFQVDYIPFGENRLHLVARKGCSENQPSLVFSGHLDTVPAGAASWETNPWEGVLKDGKIYGRGSSDMKGAVAAMIMAAIRAFETATPSLGVRIVLTAGEETGCQGAKHLISIQKELGNAAGLIVGEPTGNLPAIGHKGGLYLKGTTFGKTAHSSMPHLGVNAIYKAAEAILRAQKFEFNEAHDPLLGFPTLNVGLVKGGKNLNSVPDHAEFTIDVRTTSQTNHQQLLVRLKNTFGKDVSLETLVDLQAVSSEETHPFVQLVYAACSVKPGSKGYPMALPYLTDGAVLQPFFGGVPAVILGPGEAEMAHKTNEYCSIQKIEEAVEIYKKIILSGNDRTS